MAEIPEMVVSIGVDQDGPSSTHHVLVALSPQAHAALKQFVATGLFGFTVADCAGRMIDEQVRARWLEGWGRMVVPAAKKRRAR